MRPHGQVCSQMQQMQALHGRESGLKGVVLTNIAETDAGLGGAWSNAHFVWSG